MRIEISPERDSIPPPPYEVAVASEPTSQPVQASLRGGYIRPSLPSELPPDENDPLSATTYFENRDHHEPHVAGASPSLLEHTIRLNAETTRDDLAFPLPIQAYVGRDVTGLDWSTFANFLLPMHGEVRNGKLKSEKDSQRHSFVGEDTPARRDRILAVIAEWNENFFNPRRIRINVDFSPLASYPSSRSSPAPSAAQDLYVGCRPLQPTRSTTHGDASAQWSGSPLAPRPIHRSLSTTSSSSSGSSSSSVISIKSKSSSSSSSVDSIKSKDLEGADLGRIRSALRSFQLDATKKDHLRASVRQLCNDFRSQRQEHSKELKKEYKNQRKEIKKEIKAVVKEAKADRKADRKVRKAERKSRREGKRAERHGNDRCKYSKDVGRRAEERAAESVHRAQEKGREVERRASEKASRAHERAREAQPRGATAVARAQERVADARARGWDGEAAATQRAQEIQARSERRARETAGRARYGVHGEQETGVVLTDE